MPRPSQRGQIVGEVPGLAPEPWQVSQVVVLGTVSDVCVPSIAWSKLEVGPPVSRSRPRLRRAGRAAALPAPPGGRAGPEAVADGREAVATAAAAADRVEPPPAEAARREADKAAASYSLRFSGSESTS